MGFALLQRESSWPRLFWVFLMKLCRNPKRGVYGVVRWLVLSHVQRGPWPWFTGQPSMNQVSSCASRFLNREEETEEKVVSIPIEEVFPLRLQVGRWAGNEQTGWETSYTVVFLLSPFLKAQWLARDGIWVLICIWTMTMSDLVSSEDKERKPLKRAEKWRRFSSCWPLQVVKQRPWEILRRAKIWDSSIESASIPVRKLCQAF